MYVCVCVCVGERERERDWCHKSWCVSPTVSSDLSSLDICEGGGHTPPLHPITTWDAQHQLHSEKNKPRTHRHTETLMLTQTHTHSHTHIHQHTHTHTSTHSHTHTHTQTHTHTHCAENMKRRGWCSQAVIIEIWHIYKLGWIPKNLSEMACTPHPSVQAGEQSVTCSFSYFKVRLSVTQLYNSLDFFYTVFFFC